MFAGEAGAFPSGALLIAQKILDLAKSAFFDKHSSLLCRIVIDGENGFITLATGGPGS
jgi:hypothetical protein